jgi:hypothetical protein
VNQAHKSAIVHKAIETYSRSSLEYLIEKSDRAHIFLGAPWEGQSYMPSN